MCFVPAGAAGLLSAELLAAGADPHARTEVGSNVVIHPNCVIIDL